jgi:hypothetical protein
MEYFSAEKGHPGTNYADESNLEIFTEKMQKLGRWAEGRCDVLVLTIHWGNNWVRQTQPVHRKMAQIAFENGVDLILGHSAHRLQGIEIIEGRAVIYDMGNLLFDCQLKPEGQQSGLFRLHLSTNGVHRIEFIPTQVLNGYTVLAGYEESQKILAVMGDLCSSLGTSLSVDEDLEGRPIGVIEIMGTKTIHLREPDPDLAYAVFPVNGEEISPMVSDSVLAHEIPENTLKIIPPVELAPGVELLASRLPDTAVEGRILNISTWWCVTGRVGRNIMLAFLLSVEGQTPRRATPWYTRHDPGDWTLPLSMLKPGQIVEDRYPARLAGLPAGQCKVYALVIDTTRIEDDLILGKQQFLGEITILPKENR